MSIIIRLQNLPRVANSLDIRRYFQGLNIPQGGVHIVGGEENNAFITFGSDEDACQAMERDGGKIKGVRVKLFLSSRAEKQRIIDHACAQHTAPSPAEEERRRPIPDDRSRIPLRERSPLRLRPSPWDRRRSRSPRYSRGKDRSRTRPLGHQGRPPCEAGMVVMVKGLPYNTSEQDVSQFFSGLNVLNIVVEHDRCGRATGTAFVEFGDKRDFETAMNMKGRKIGHRYIELGMGSRDFMYATRNGDSFYPDSMPMDQSEEESSVVPGVGPRRRPELAVGPGHGAGPMHGMGPLGPYYGFGYSLVPPGHTSVSMLGLPSTVTYRDIADFFATQGVIPCAIHIMFGEKGLPTGYAIADFESHADSDRAFLQDGANLGHHVIALKMIPYSEVAQAMGGQLRPDGHLDGHPDNCFDQRFDGRVHDRGDGRPDGGLPGFMRPESQTACDRRPAKRPRLPDTRLEGPLFPERDGPVLRAPHHEEPGMDGFGEPGCVVSATNVPYLAGVDDIIRFFKGYELTEGDIMRRFDDWGRPTEDARIAFATPRDAQEALAKFNRRPMLGRMISLGIL
ncbi:RNA-binding protein 12B-like [Amblyomma americanum]